MAQNTPLYIVASPQPRVGKTLIARLLLEFFRDGGRAALGYDLNPRDPLLAERYPAQVSIVDIADTRGQMALFDRLIAEPAVTAVVDLGYAAFEQFFAIVGEIGFAQEARRRLIEPIVLFVSDRMPATARSYAELRERLPATTFVPIHNESVSVMFETADFPPSRPEFRMIRVPRLSPIVRGVIDRPSFSVAAYLTERPGGPTEVHDWINTIFNEFRELELRLLMGRLSSAITTGARARGSQGLRLPRN